MSNTVVFLLITAAIFALLALWAPCLHLCRRGVRKVTRRRELLAAAIVVVGLGMLSGCSDSGSPAGTTPTTPKAATTIYVTNQPSGTNSTGQVLVYSASAATSTSTTVPTPTATLTLPATYKPYAVATDSTGQLYVAALPQPTSATTSGQVLVYAAGATSASTPARTISLGVNTLGLGLAVDSTGNLYVATQNYNGGNGAVAVYASSANGTATPTRLINGTNTGMATYGPVGIAVDGSGNIYAAPYSENSIPTSVLVFSSTTTGNVAPTRTISGSSTGLTGTGIFQLATDSSGNLYVPAVGGTYPNYTTSVLVFGSSANGNVAPTRSITGLYFYAGIAVDGVGNVYASGFNSGLTTPRALVFSATASGNATPLGTLLSTAWTSSNTGSVAVY